MNNVSELLGYLPLLRPLVCPPVACVEGEDVSRPPHGCIIGDVFEPQDSLALDHINVYQIWGLVERHCEPVILPYHDHRPPSSQSNRCPINQESAQIKINCNCSNNVIEMQRRARGTEGRNPRNPSGEEKSIQGQVRLNLKLHLDYVGVGPSK